MQNGAKNRAPSTVRSLEKRSAPEHRRTSKNELAAENRKIPTTLPKVRCNDTEVSKAFIWLIASPCRTAAVTDAGFLPRTKLRLHCRTRSRMHAAHRKSHRSDPQRSEHDKRERWRETINSPTAARLENARRKRSTGREHAAEAGMPTRRHRRQRTECSAGACDMPTHLGTVWKDISPLVRDRSRVQGGMMNMGTGLSGICPPKIPGQFPAQ